MQPPRMVHLTDVPNEFTARVMVAKLGSAGIVAEVRGAGGPYPNLAAPGIFVEEIALLDARELISADLDDGFAIDAGDLEPVGDRPGAQGGRRAVRAVMVATALLLLGSVTIGPRCSATPVVHTK